jgi:hypothetical protein
MRAGGLVGPLPRVCVRGSCALGARDSPRHGPAPPRARGWWIGGGVLLMEWVIFSEFLHGLSNPLLTLHLRGLLLLALTAGPSCLHSALWWLTCCLLATPYVLYAAVWLFTPGFVSLHSSVWLRRCCGSTPSAFATLALLLKGVQVASVWFWCSAQYEHPPHDGGQGV